MSTVEKPMICLETRATYVAPRTKGMVGKIGWECDPEGALITFKNSSRWQNQGQSVVDGKCNKHITNASKVR